MKVKLWCNSGANVYSENSEVIDTEDWGWTDEEWNAASNADKQQFAEEWAYNAGLEIGFREL